VRTAALGALAQQKAPSAFELLQQAVGTESPDDRLRIAALRALGGLGDDRAVPLMVEWSAASKPIDVRAAAIFGLGRLAKNDKEITRRLVGFLEEPYQNLRFNTVFALVARGDQDAIAPLEKLAADPNLGEGMADFIRGQVVRLKPRPAGAQPGAPGGAASPQGQARAEGAGPTNQQILQAIEKLQKDTEEIKERLKKLEERIGEKK
jgi:HEAT repeat protein